MGDYISADRKTI